MTQDGDRSKPLSQRKRLKLGLTVHPRTLDRLAVMADRLGTNRGRIVDRLVESFAAAYEDGIVRCIHGQVCTIGRKDLPTVL